MCEKTLCTGFSSALQIYEEFRRTKQLEATFFETKSKDAIIDSTNDHVLERKREASGIAIRLRNALEQSGLSRSSAKIVIIFEKVKKQRDFLQSRQRVWTDRQADLHTVT